jgi:predicted DsbA family dithiol-disulfide isomerase
LGFEYSGPGIPCRSTSGPLNRLIKLVSDPKIRILMAMTPIPISHFSDVLCVWAYIAQIRVAELHANFPGEVELEYRYFNVFGDITTKMAAQWQERGGISGYAQHVQEVAAQFDHVRLHPDAWVKNTPTSSMPAHLVLCAVRSLEAEQGGVDVLLRLDAAIRTAFFEHNVDVSRTDALFAIIEKADGPVDRVRQLLDNGEAHAALARDLKDAADIGIRSSPTLTFNEGRQTLAGNVGYRVLEANIRELINAPADQLSWC